GAAADSEGGLCGNGLDDDADGAPDCMDDECAADPACLFPCADEALGAVASVSVAGGNYATVPKVDASCATDASDRIYVWTAPHTGRFVFETAGSAHDTVLA